MSTADVFMLHFGWGRLGGVLGEQLVQAFVQDGSQIRCLGDVVGQRVGLSKTGSNRFAALGL